ncbi:MAG: hypothetical protein IBX41_02555 [Methanophagales archaeon]|nr:hypothetical protein [Methanophagales archaeon]
MKWLSLPTILYIYPLIYINFLKTGEVRATVSSDASSIGSLSLGYVDETVKAVRIDGVEATVENVHSKRER